ncbi:MAG: AcrR family transcriptional regulator [Maricaulis sp.]|jgi:AcrR family transcriptional regulator
MASFHFRTGFNPKASSGNQFENEEISVTRSPTQTRRSAGRPKNSDDGNSMPDLILEVAIRLSAERGPEQVTIKEIAAAAGVATSLVHHHFGKRADLHKTCCEHVLSVIQALIGSLENNLPKEVSPSDLDYLGDALISGLRERVCYLRFLAMLFFSRDAQAKKVFQAYFNILHQVTTRYEQAGMLRDDLDPIWVTTQLIYSQLGTVFLQSPLAEVLHQDPYSLENSVERAATFIRIAKYGMFKDRPD